MRRSKWRTLKGLRQDTINVLYCYSQVCHLAVAVEFAGNGYPVMELEGGFCVWQEGEFAIER